MLSTLYRKAKAYEAGERIEFGGRTYPPLYTPRNRTLLALFESPYWLDRVIADQPELTLEKLVAEGDLRVA